MKVKKRDYSADTPNSSSLLDTDDALCACVFELVGVEGDDADADADTKVDSGTTRPASTTTSDDARVNDGLGGSDGSPDNSGRGADVPLRLASISATRGPGSHTRGGLGAGAGAGTHRRGADIDPDVNSAG
jgi:hypothetical protein